MKNQIVINLLLTAALLPGCGSSPNDIVSNNFVSNTPVSTDGGFNLRGRIVNEQGEGQSGVRLIANERTSDAKIETISGPGGQYQLSLPAGVYDVGLDRPGDAQTATCFYGPLTPDLPVSDLVLHSSNGQPAGTVSGKLWLRPGVPASNRKVSLRSAHLTGPQTPLSLTTTTAFDGTFRQVLSSQKEIGVDVEVFDSLQNFDEFIEIGKLSKPAYVEFFTELPVATNRLRSDETDAPERLDLAAKAGEFTLFDKLDTRPDPQGGPGYLVFSQGLLPVSKTQYTFFDGIITPPVALQFNKYRGLVASGPIRVDRNGSWWWTYAVNIKPDSRSYWLFEDETTDQYSLSVYLTSSWHKVSYNSDKPNIQGIATLDPTS